MALLRQDRGRGRGDPRPAGSRLAEPRRRRGAARRLPPGRRGHLDRSATAALGAQAGGGRRLAQLAALCVTRSADGRWLAGRRAPWVSSWAGRWALGAGGAVDLGESPADTLVRELEEEWAVAPSACGRGADSLPHQLVMFVGQAWIAEGADERVRPDDEHDAFAWWPRGDRRLAGRGRRGAAAHGSLAFDVNERRAGVGPLTFTRLKGPLVHPLVRVHGAADVRLRRSAGRSPRRSSSG